MSNRPRILVAIWISATLLIGCGDTPSAVPQGVVVVSAPPAFARVDLGRPQRVSRLSVIAPPWVDRTRTNWIESAIRSSGGPTTIKLEDGRLVPNELMHADVVLVGDYHAIGYCQESFFRIAYLLRRGMLDSRPIVLFVEAMPAVQSEREREIALRLNECWPWPTEHIRSGLEWARAKGIEVLPGLQLDCSLAPIVGLPDSKRKPSKVGQVGLSPEEWLRTLKESDEVAASTIVDRLSGSHAGVVRVLALIGLLHVGGVDGVRARLERAGLSVCVVVPHDLSLDDSVRHLRARNPLAWFRVGRDLVVPPRLVDLDTSRDLE